MSVCTWLLVGLLVGFSARPASAQKPDFSGMWTLNRAASQFTMPPFSGGRGGHDIDRLFITQAANGTLIIGTETNGLKAWSYTPGREVTISVGRDTTMRATSRWDGDRLIAEGRQGDMTMHEVMSLGPDRQTLMIDILTTTPDGETSNRLIYTLESSAGPCKEWAMPCKEFPQGVP